MLHSAHRACSRAQAQGLQQPCHQAKNVRAPCYQQRHSQIYKPQKVSDSFTCFAGPANASLKEDDPDFDGPVVFDMTGLDDDSSDEEEDDATNALPTKGDIRRTGPGRGTGSRKPLDRRTPQRPGRGQVNGRGRQDDRSRFDVEDEGQLATEAADPGDRNQAVTESDNYDNIYYKGTLTSADLDKDPKGHVSGYVAIIGRPNAGKSTLMNALVGQKLSIVSHKAQTTRHRILGILSSVSSQAVMIDTPGVIDVKRNTLEGRMMSVVKTAMRDADAVVAIVDSSHYAEEVLDMVQPPPDFDGPPLCVVLNKSDLVSEERANELKAWYETNCRCDKVICIAAIDAEGTDEVRKWMVSKLPEGPTLYPKELISEHPERFFVSEIIREHIFKMYNEEVPYCVQVNVTDFKERKTGKDFVACELVCERESHKGILLGRKGSAMKALATSARLDIEGFLGRPVYLEMKVRHDKDWRTNAETLKKFGY